MSEEGLFMWSSQRDYLLVHVTLTQVFGIKYLLIAVVGNNTIKSMNSIETPRVPLSWSAIFAIGDQ